MARRRADSTKRGPTWYLCKSCRVGDAPYRKEYNQNRRIKLLEHVSGESPPKCNTCGFDDWRALQIDHIHGDGNQETFGDGGAWGYKLLKLTAEEVRKDYQVLCANCNWVKRYENKEYN